MRRTRFIFSVSSLFCLTLGCASLTEDDLITDERFLASDEASSPENSNAPAGESATSETAMTPAGASPTTSGVASGGTSAGETSPTTPTEGSSTGGSATVEVSVCMAGDTMACSELDPTRPVGEASCALSGAGYDQSSCGVCENDATQACQDPALPEGTETCVAGDWVPACSACTVGESVDCSSLAIGATLPYGSAECVTDGSTNSYDSSACVICEGDMTTACSGLAIGATKPVGDATCSAGVWNEDACMVCVPSSTVACSIAAPDTPAGDATCNAQGDGYDLTGCTLCAASTETKACTEFTDQDYTGGIATCDASGNAFDKASCEYCGNDVQESGEDCDGAAAITGTTCEDVGFTGDTDAVTSCKTDCTYDVAVCSICELGVTSCLGEDPVSTDCAGSACDDAQCGSGMTCAATTGYNDEIDNFSCNESATCSIQCGGGDKRCNVDCKSGSNCSVDATRNKSNLSGTLNCADGGTCDWDFRQSQTQITSGLTMNCESGATCNTFVGNYGTTVSTVVCQSGSTCNLTFDNNNQKQSVTSTCESGATCNCVPDTTGSNLNQCICNGAGC